MNRKGHYRGQPLIDLTCDPKDLPPEPLSPTGGPLLPEPRRPPHEAGCWCVACWQAGLAYGEYLKAKNLEW
jgi:hypothetical protein